LAGQDQTWSKYWDKDDWINEQINQHMVLRNPNFKPTPFRKLSLICLVVWIAIIVRPLTHDETIAKTVKKVFTAFQLANEDFPELRT